MCRDELEERLGALETQLAEALGENEKLRVRVKELEGRLEEARRGAKRQAAPFSKGEPLPDPARPGRKPGEAHKGTARRERPDSVDRTTLVELPAACPDCGGALCVTGVSEQTQIDMPPVAPEVTRYLMQRGRCTRCKKTHVARHPDQTSTATGACGVLFGPRAVAAATMLHQELGASFDKVATVLHALGGIRADRSTWCRAGLRLGEAAGTAYGALGEEIRHADEVSMDETGWRVGGRGGWLWVAAGATGTYYRIARSRGFDVAKDILGEGYAGVLVRDGWAVYTRFGNARHQTCAAHLLRRASEMENDAPTRHQARLPRQVKLLLKDAIALRDRRRAGLVDDTVFSRERRALDERTGALLARTPRTDSHRRLIKHLRRERDALFTFLDRDGVEATNWRAEQAIRPAVVNRKVFGGNRTEAGARTAERLMSVIRTCRQRTLDPIAYLTDLQRGRAPTVPVPAS